MSIEERAKQLNRGTFEKRVIPLKKYVRFLGRQDRPYTS